MLYISSSQRVGRLTFPQAQLLNSLTQLAPLLEEAVQIRPRQENLRR